MGNWGYGHHVFEKRPYVCERCSSIGTPKEMDQWISPAKSSKPYIYVYLSIYNYIYILYTHTSFWGLLYVALESLVKHWRSCQQPNQVMVVSPPGSSGVGGDWGSAADRWNPVQRMDKIWENHIKSSVKTIQDNCNPKRGFSLWQFYISVTSNRARVLKLWVERGARLTIPN